MEQRGEVLLRDKAADRDDHRNVVGEPRMVARRIFLRDHGIERNAVADDGRLAGGQSMAEHGFLPQIGGDQHQPGGIADQSARDQTAPDRTE